MSKYTIEGNINFQDELYKLLDEESDNEDELCQITGLPLKDKFVTLECKHHFNYDAVYKEIYKQKYEFNTYARKALHKKDLQKLRHSKLDYFIKCPYCRNLQFTILPYYEELGLKEIYGINSLDKTEKNKIMAVKAAIYKEREEKMNERKKLLEEKNAEREAKGLPPLKRLPIIKKKVENVVEKGQTIQAYVPDDEQTGCKAILKSGPNKGNECRCKKIEANGLCKRHSPKDEINNELKVDKNVL
jgi:hypothetical protein